MVEENDSGATGPTIAMVNGRDVKQPPATIQQDDETSFRHKVERLLLCPVCHDIVTDPRQLNCGHFLCFECIELLTVDDAVRCAKCSLDTPVTAEGIRLDELAARLLLLLEEYGPKTVKAQNGPGVTIPPPTNGIDKYVDEDDDEPSSEEEAEEEEVATVTPPTVNADSTPAADDKVVTEPATDHHVPPVVVTEPAADHHVPPVVVTEPAADHHVPPVVLEQVNSPAEGDANADTTPAVNVDEAPALEVDKQMSADTVEVILEPPVDYQSPDEESADQPSSTIPAATSNEAAKMPVEHDVMQTEEKLENTDGAGEVKEEPAGVDEPDRVMKASEIKPSDVAMSIETERQCGDCHSAKCTCNVSLLTPPVSNGSQLSVETNTSLSLSEDGDDIPVKPIAKFPVSESASHIEVANRNRIYVTRWTYDENGAVLTLDSNGNKIKFIHSARNNYAGIAISKLGFVFVLNTSKHRIEEYSGVDGKKVKNVKLELCRDPHAVDIMPTGEILVVDQEKNRVIVYPNSKKGSIKPRILTNSLIKDPHDIATCSDGFYITCTGSRYLLKMDLDGNIIWKYNGQSSEESKLSKVLQGVCTDESGNVYIVDRDNDAVLLLSSDGDVKGRMKVRERSHKNQRPWYVSVKDKTMAVLYSHSTVKTFQLV